VDSAIQLLNNWGQINLYPLDNAIGFPNAYPTFEQLGPGGVLQTSQCWKHKDSIMPDIFSVNGLCQ